MTSEGLVKQVYPAARWDNNRIVSPLNDGRRPAVTIYLSSKISVPRGTKSAQERCWDSAWRRIAAARAAEK
jgi:hypothetical protein